MTRAPVHQEIKGIKGVGEVNHRVTDTDFFGQGREGHGQDSKKGSATPVGSFFHSHSFFHVLFLLGLIIVFKQSLKMKN